MASPAKEKAKVRVTGELACSVEAADLRRAVGLVRNFARQKKTMPILCCALLRVREGVLTVEATDLETFVAITVAATETKDGTIAVPALTLHGALVGASGTLHLKARDVFNLELSDNEVTSILKGADAEFPEAVIPQVTSTGSAPAKELRESLLRVAGAASVDETRYNLNGVRIEQEGAATRFVATDGHRIAIEERPWSIPTGGGAGWPLDFLKLLTKALPKDDTSVVVSGFDTDDAVHRDVLVSWGDVSFFARTIDGEFPNWKGLVADARKNHHRVTVERDVLSRILDRVASVSDLRSKPIRLAVSNDGKLSLSTTSLDFGEARAAIPLLDWSRAPEADPFVVGFNGRYLRHAIDFCAGETLTFHVEDPVCAAVCAAVVTGSDSPDRFIVVMPMRL